MTQTCAITCELIDFSTTTLQYLTEKDSFADDNLPHTFEGRDLSHATTETTKTMRNTVSGLETHQPIMTSTRNNSSAFKFLAPPPELRNMIYRELFTPNSSAPRGSHPQILASYHQIYNEAMELFYILTQIQIDIHPWFVGFNNGVLIRFYQQNKCPEVQRYLYVCDNLSIRIVTTQHPGSQSLYTEHFLDPLLGEKVKGLVGKIVVYNKELKSIHINLEVRNKHLLSSLLERTDTCLRSFRASIFQETSRYTRREVLGPYLGT